MPAVLKADYALMFVPGRFTLVTEKVWDYNRRRFKQFSIYKN